MIMIPILLFSLLHCSNDEWFLASHPYASSFLHSFLQSCYIGFGM
jgi:hypothetical protein